MLTQQPRISRMPRITVTLPDQNPQPYRFSLDRQVVHFGRGDDNDIHLDSGSVSSEHAVMERTIGGYILKDLGSTNGIKLDGERVDKINLRNGQEIHLGDVEFGFELNEDEMIALNLEDPTSQLPPIENEMASASSANTAPEIQLSSDLEPRVSAPPQQQAMSQAAEQTSPFNSPGFSKLVTYAAVLAFLLGVAMRFQAATGESLVTALIQKVTGG